MGTAIAVCMGATIVANFFAAAVFDSTGSYLPVWQTYSVLLLLAIVPAHFLVRRAGQTSTSIANPATK